MRSSHDGHFGDAELGDAELGGAGQSAIDARPPRSIERANDGRVPATTLRFAQVNANTTEVHCCKGAGT